MGLLNWMFDIYQHDQINQVRQKQTSERWEVLEELAAAREEAAAIRSTSGSIDEARLAEAVGELALGVKALQRMLVRNGVIDPDELAAMVRTVDREDGAEDGRSPI